MSSHPDFIRQTLRQAPAHWGVDTRALPTADKIFIRCPIHKNGQERTPSFLVNIKPVGKFPAGNGRCMACGQRFTWNDLYQRLTGQILPEHDQDDFSQEIWPNELLAAITDDIDVIHELDYKRMLPWSSTQNWRGINGALVKAVGGRLFFNKKMEQQELFLPCFVNRRLVGGVRANIEKRGKRNYFNTPGQWAFTHGLFPYDYTKKFIADNGFDCVVPVEGPRDALNSLQHGIPAICLLGASAWSENKADLLISLGVSTVITAFDPDEAGKKLTAAVYASLRDEINVGMFSFPTDLGKDGDKVDPGNMHELPDVLHRFQSVVNRYKVKQNDSALG